MWCHVRACATAECAWLLPHLMSPARRVTAGPGRVGKRRFAGNRASGRVECLFEVGDQVVGRLDADGEPHEVVGDGER